MLFCSHGLHMFTNYFQYCFNTLNCCGCFFYNITNTWFPATTPIKRVSWWETYFEKRSQERMPEGESNLQKKRIWSKRKCSVAAIKVASAGKNYQLISLKRKNEGTWTSMFHPHCNQKVAVLAYKTYILSLLGWPVEKSGSLLQPPLGQCKFQVLSRHHLLFIDNIPRDCLIYAH